MIVQRFRVHAFKGCAPSLLSNLGQAKAVIQQVLDNMQPGEDGIALPALTFVEQHV